MEETIWVKDFNVLFNKENMFKYIPLNSYSNYEKINSTMRFTLYLSILLSFIFKNLNYLFIFIICSIITYLMYINENKNEDLKITENYSNYDKAIL